MSSRTTSVLIVGAGPVGLALACELARRNVSFRLIERAAGAPQSSRAKALQPRSIEILDDLGIAEHLMNVGTTELPFRKFMGAQPLGDAPRSVFPREDSRYPKTLLLPQWHVESALRAKLEQLGGTVEWSSELGEFKNDAAGITARVQKPSGIEEIACTYLVACDGGRGTTRKKLGVEFVGETHQEETMWVGDVELEGLTPDAWYNWMSPKFGLGYALFPFKGTNTWQVQAVIGPDASGSIPTPTLEGFAALFKERTQMQNVTFTKSTWQSIYRVNIRRASSYRVGNAFIAGDAAHVHSVAGGMGMNTGIQDVYNLGWKLAAVIHGTANASLLDTYAEERIPIADWLLTTTSERQKVMLGAAVAGAGAMDKIATKDTTQLDLNYRERRLSGKGAATQSGLQSGDRAPNVKLADGTWLSERLRGTQWKVLAFGGKSAPTDTGLNVVRADDPAVAKAYGVNEGLVLIRPDGYVALIATDASAVGDYLSQLAVA